MVKGFLLIDQHKNTIILPVDDPDLQEFFRYKPGGPNAVDRIKTHRTFQDLWDDVRAYLKNEYKEDRNESDV